MSEPKFTERFDKFACTGDVIRVTIGEFEAVARIEYDQDTGIDDTDCYPEEYSTEIFGDDTPKHRACFEAALAARRAWERSEWFFCGVVVTIYRDGQQVGTPWSLWGLECNFPGSDNSYLTEVANELLVDALAEAKKKMAQWARDYEMQHGHTYTRAEIVNGTGFPRGARFIMVDFTEEG